jgi:hypothetical protein
MRNKIEREFIRNNQPFIAFYKMPDGNLKCNFSAITVEEMYIVLLSFQEMPELMNAFEKVISMAKDGTYRY